MWKPINDGLPLNVIEAHSTKNELFHWILDTALDITKMPMYTYVVCLQRNEPLFGVTYIHICQAFLSFTTRYVDLLSIFATT